MLRTIVQTIRNDGPASLKIQLVLECGHFMQVRKSDKPKKRIHCPPVCWCPGPRVRPIEGITMTPGVPLLGYNQARAITRAIMEDQNVSTDATRGGNDPDRNRYCGDGGIDKRGPGPDRDPSPPECERGPRGNMGDEAGTKPTEIQIRTVNDGD